jgi:hypothetical protein
MQTRTAVFTFSASLLFLSATACRGSKDDGPSVADASVAVPTTTVATASPLPSASAVLAAPQPDEGEAAVDPGPEAGVRKRRRIAANTTDAGPALETGPSAPPPSPVAEPTAKRTERTGVTAPMADDVPYGGPGRLGAPILRKTPLPSDDPWAKTDAAK